MFLTFLPSLLIKFDDNAIPDTNTKSIYMTLDYQYLT